MNEQRTKKAEDDPDIKNRLVETLQSFITNETLFTSRHQIFYTPSVQQSKDEIKKEDIKQTYPNSGLGIDYTFLVGRSFSDARTDYEGFIGVPVLWNLFKLNAGYEYLDKRILIGATVTF